MTIDNGKYANFSRTRFEIRVIIISSRILLLQHSRVPRRHGCLCCAVRTLHGPVIAALVYYEFILCSEILFRSDDMKTCRFDLRLWTDRCTTYTATNRQSFLFWTIHYYKSNNNFPIYCISSKVTCLHFWINCQN